MRNLISALLALALAASSALAADMNVAPLVAGKPAGIHKADLAGNSTLFLILGAAAVVGIIVAVGSNTSSSPAVGVTGVPSGSSTTTTG